MVLRIKDILKEKKIGVKELSDLTGLSYNYCSGIVRGDRFPRQENLILIAKTLDVDIKDLFYSTKDATIQDRILSIENHLEQIKKGLDTTPTP